LKRIGCNERLKERGQIIHNSLFFGQLLDLMFESYTVVAISCYINIEYFGWSSPGEVL